KDSTKGRPHQREETARTKQNESARDDELHDVPNSHARGVWHRHVQLGGRTVRQAGTRYDDEPSEVAVHRNALPHTPASARRRTTSSCQPSQTSTQERRLRSTIQANRGSRP